MVFGALPFLSMEYAISIVQKCQTYYIIDRMKPGFEYKFIFTEIFVKLGFNNIFFNSACMRWLLKKFVKKILICNSLTSVANECTKA